VKKIILFILLFVTTFYNLNAQKSYHADSIDVLNYNIHLNITDFNNQNIIGFTELKLVPKYNNLHYIQLDLLSFFIDSITINGVYQSFWDYDDTLLSIKLIQPAFTSDTINVAVYYYGHPQEDPGINHWGGFKWSGNSCYNLGVGFTTVPHNFGRCWFPCNDNFVDRATYDFRILVNSSILQIAVCSGILVGKDTANCACTGKAEYHWQITDPIPTYLASVAIDAYSVINDTYYGIADTIPIQLWVRTSDSLKAIGTFTNLKNILSLFESKFGPYRWQRVGYVGVNFDAGAMEHATNVAFPNICITGNTTYEELYTHELSHSWFGNLITCSTAQDMWINEGWATFCEMVYEEAFKGNTVFLKNKRTKLNKVLRYNQIEEGEFLTLNNVSDSLTYGSTSYDKGGLVVHTLRSYLGDSLFYASVKDLLETYKFKDINSYQMRDYLSARTGINLNDFFNNWVFTPGFSHFSVDSFNVVPTGNNFDVTVFAREKLKGRTTYSNNNYVEITFMDSLWNKTSRVINITAGFGNETYNLPFKPICVFMDLFEKTDDATTDIYKTVKNTGSVTFDQTYFSGYVISATDSSFVRVEHNWVAPDDFKTTIQGVGISKERYWKIDGIIPTNFIMSGKFLYSTSTNSTNGYLDNLLITTNSDSLVLLYRKNTSEDWQIKNHTKQGNDISGYIITDSVKTGEYALGIRDWNLYHSISENNVNNNNLLIYPNPANNSCVIKFNFNSGDVIKVVDSLGNVYKTININNSDNKINLDLSNFKSGFYFVKLTNKNNKTFTSKLVIK